MRGIDIYFKNRLIEKLVLCEDAHMRILKRRMKLKKNFHTGGNFEMYGGCGKLCTFFLVFFIRILTYENCNIFKRTNFNLSMSINKLIRLVSLFEIALLIIHLLRLIFISFIRV